MDTDIKDISKLQQNPMTPPQMIINMILEFIPTVIIINYYTNYPRIRYYQHHYGTSFSFQC